MIINSINMSLYMRLQCENGKASCRLIFSTVNRKMELRSLCQDNNASKIIDQYIVLQFNLVL